MHLEDRVNSCLCATKPLSYAIQYHSLIFVYLETSSVVDLMVQVKIVVYKGEVSVDARDKIKVKSKNFNSGKHIVTQFAK